MIANSSNLILPKCPYLDKQLCTMWTISYVSCDHSRYKELSRLGWDGQERRSDPQYLKESERSGVVHLPLKFPSGWFRSCVRTRHTPQQSLKSWWGLFFWKKKKKMVLLYFLQLHWGAIDKQNCKTCKVYVVMTCVYIVRGLPQLVSTSVISLYIFLFFFLGFAFFFGERHLNSTLLANFHYMIQGP